MKLLYWPSMIRQDYANGPILRILIWDLLKHLTLASAGMVRYIRQVCFLMLFFLKKTHVFHRKEPWRIFFLLRTIHQVTSSMPMHTEAMPMQGILDCVFSRQIPE